MSDDVSERAQCEGLELELLEHSGQLEVAMMEISSLQQKIAGLEEECLDRNKMAKEWYDALQVYVQLNFIAYTRQESMCNNVSDLSWLGAHSVVYLRGPWVKIYFVLFP